MDKRTYVERLKQMLESKGERACAFCPVTPYYSGERVPLESDCSICQKFVGLRVDAFYGPLKCPCYRPGRLGAIPRAWKKIREYERVHGEV